jgi:hypothetical protein
MSANGIRQDGHPAVLASPQPSLRAERRQDRLTAAQIARDDQAARATADIARAEAQARLRRDEQLGRQATRRVARARRASWRAARTAWLREHVTSLLFIPVIVVPGVLAWTAMAAYGKQVFGPAGVSLPAFSEGAMWAFAGATTITRRRHPGSPVWHLLLGTAVFAGFGAVLNFAHGLADGSVITGVVMALISVSGVTAHQLITAGPRRTRGEREISRAGRAAERRQRTIARAARRRCVAEVAEDGSVRLVHSPGTVRLGRDRLGRARITAVPVAGVTPQELAALRAQLGEERAKADAAEITLRSEIEIADSARAEAEERAARAEEQAEDFARQLDAVLRAAREREAPKPVRLTPAAARAKAAEILGAHPGISGAELGERVGRTGRWGQDFKKTASYPAR